MSELPSRTVAWHISSYSQGGGGNCVEAGPVRDGSMQVAVRDSTRRGSGILLSGRPAWSAFIRWTARAD